MEPTFRAKLKQMLIDHEGYARYPYIDSTHHVTIGIGYNLTDRGISDQWINQTFNDDIDFFNDRLSEFCWFHSLSDNQKMALINMAFNLGLKKFLTFKRMLSYLQQHDYIHAAYEMLDSKWSRQVGQRAQDLAKLMEDG